MRKKREIGLLEAIKKVSDSNLDKAPHIGREIEDIETGSIKEKADRILGIINDQHRPVNNMLFFVMYDIESNKVRHQVSKYLIKKGCTRIQRSIFLADLSSSTYEQIKQDLSAVQSMYENPDSIIIVPISVNYLESMKIIGKNIDIDIIANKKNTLFF